MGSVRQWAKAYWAYIDLNNMTFGGYLTFLFSLLVALCLIAPPIIRVIGWWWGLWGL